METLKHPACTVGWVARLCRSWLSPGKAKPEFPIGEIPLGQYCCKKKKKYLKKKVKWCVSFGSQRGRPASLLNEDIHDIGERMHTQDGIHKELQDCEFGTLYYYLPS